MTGLRFPHGLWSRSRAALRRLLGRPASDWAGPDQTREAIRAASPILPDDHNRHEIVWLGAATSEIESLLRGLAARGHRVHRDEGRREGGPAATVIALQDEARLETAERLRAANGWPLLRVPLAEPSGLTEGTLSAALARAFPLVSIVIVTYNNLELNRLCLDSVFARTEWPNLEVIVVDNGSSDGTPELLAGLAARRDDLRVVAWPENRGYPAACNAGLSRAAGEILVLLNNDTVVTRGWLTALHRHLARNPRLGLVGPVTNAIANEAKVDVGYSDLDALPAWAAEWVRRHDGETFPISMLAFFCVALRRATYEAVGPLDEQFGLGLFEDGDYNRRAREKGWEIRCARDSFVHHWQNASFRRLGREAYFALYEENRRKFEAKWGKPLEPPPTSD